MSLAPKVTQSPCFCYLGLVTLSPIQGSILPIYTCGILFGNCKCNLCMMCVLCVIVFCNLIVSLKVIYCIR